MTDHCHYCDKELDWMTDLVIYKQIEPTNTVALCHRCNEFGPSKSAESKDPEQLTLNI